MAVQIEEIKKQQEQSVAAAREEAGVQITRATEQAAASIAAAEAAAPPPPAAPPGSTATKAKVKKAGGQGATTAPPPPATAPSPGNDATTPAAALAEPEGTEALTVVASSADSEALVVVGVPVARRAGAARLSTEAQAAEGLANLLVRPPQGPASETLARVKAVSRVTPCRPPLPLSAVTQRRLCAPAGSTPPAPPSGHRRQSRRGAALHGRGLAGARVLLRAPLRLPREGARWLIIPRCTASDCPRFGDAS